MKPLFYVEKLAFLRPLYYRMVRWYYRKPRRINHRGIKIHLYPSVFHPSMYLSTDVLLDFALAYPIHGAKVCELGAGSGFISLYLAAHQQCHVTATDINPSALAGLRRSMSLNDVEIDCIRSDIFDAIDEKDFDFILVNPPYYKAKPSTWDQHAFYGGENLEYFHRFFDQVSTFLLKQSKVFMILSETAPIDEIRAVATLYERRLIEVTQSITNSERLIIFDVQ